jgi:putative phosphoribosyl transferase
MVAGARAVRQLGARWIIAAAPLVATDAIARILDFADECVSLAALDDLGSVGAGYIDFNQTTDEEVRALLSSLAPVPSS